MSSSTFIPRFDASDPKRPDRVVKPIFKAPADAMGPFSNGTGMVLAAGAMFTRIPALAFMSFFLSVMSIINQSGIQNDSAQSPWTSLMMSTTSIFNIYLQRHLNPVVADPAAVGAVPVPT